MYQKGDARNEIIQSKIVGGINVGEESRRKTETPKQLSPEEIIRLCLYDEFLDRLRQKGLNISSDEINDIIDKLTAAQEKAKQREEKERKRREAAEAKRQRQLAQQRRQEHIREVTVRFAAADMTARF